MRLRNKIALTLTGLLAMGFAAGCGDMDPMYSGNGAYYPPTNNAQPQADAGTQADEDYQEGENYQEWVENDFIETSSEDTSTFAVDVDNGSYTEMRRDIESKNVPVPEGVRVEEYENFFK